MKKLIALLAFTAFFVSCSDDDTVAPQEEPFFNLEVGNKWVYKRYNQSGPNGEYEFSSRIDTVKVTGQQVVEGENYYVLNHKIYSSGNFSEEFEELLRVNSNGYLIDSSGLVHHPGGDMSYQATTTVQDIGEINFQLQETESINVDGGVFNVYPYVGYFTPFPTNAIPEGIGSIYYYKSGLGFALIRCRFLSAELYYEDRLVHYELN